MKTLLTSYMVGILLVSGPLYAQYEVQDIAFDPAIHAERRARLMEKTGDAAVILPGRYLARQDGLDNQDPNFWYMTGVESPYAILVMIPAEGGRREVLFLPDTHQFAAANYPRQDKRYRATTWNTPMDRLVPGNDAVRRTGIREIYLIDEFEQRIGEIAGSVETIYFGRDHASYYAPPGLSSPQSINQQLEDSLKELFPDAAFESATPLILDMRMIKDEHELARIRKAVEISAMSLREAGRAIEPGKNALEIAGLMEYVWKREGSPRTFHPSMVATGNRSLVLYSLQHENYHSTNRVMLAGELAYIDYGTADYNMYFSDVCRTFPVSGKFTAEQRKYYDIVVEAQEAAIELVRPGVTMRDLIEASAQVFKDHGLEKYEDIDTMGADKVWGVFPSPAHYLNEGPSGPDTDLPVRGLGHHVGLVVARGFRKDQVLEPGMVITIEPKLYIPELNTGMMVEDVIVVTEDGYENLSASLPKKAEEIEALMEE
jgi:Xaa-Pro aminopeptidase